MTMAYFAIIGFAFMLIQIGLLQRFSVYLGHPTYTLAIVLFSMLLFTGVGSLVSERLADRAGGRFRLVPVAIAAALVLTALVLPAVIARTIGLGLPARTRGRAGLRRAALDAAGHVLPDRRAASPRITPAVVAWAWGVNGAFGVLASILAVGLSIWVGIDANFWIAAALYLALAVPLRALARAG